ncbi:hypothetical protein BO83DRAFT_77501 [Aspergillus eucalypticola CBS 122712]|uniref:Uncharacterized protein n=1 Tax=Aspergillus eucalypticola (strain CBS 122712 / IBT 29274) TaxID=1448314 RepID=A0A317WDW6_ASPEC|nr:uncharacterized protein BO83DRAFT_77501 [Aspergillus eucalypticola CBS 122712]PWY83941.1 hypothetical protein BO83DRAFT_77501 [Aspergillus eucalypticola CBS 122712]
MIGIAEPPCGATGGFASAMKHVRILITRHNYATKRNEAEQSPTQRSGRSVTGKTNPPPPSFTTSSSTSSSSPPPPPTTNTTRNINDATFFLLLESSWIYTMPALLAPMGMYGARLRCISYATGSITITDRPPFGFNATV